MVPASICSMDHGTACVRHSERCKPRAIPSVGPRVSALPAPDKKCIITVSIACPPSSKAAVVADLHDAADSARDGTTVLRFPDPKMWVKPNGDLTQGYVLESACLQYVEPRAPYNLSWSAIAFSSVTRDGHSALLTVTDPTMSSSS
jgi:hypothetical protein